MTSTAQLIFWLSCTWLIAVFMAYPALMFVLSRLRQHPLLTHPNYLPRVELITAAYNEQENIERKISSYQALDYPRTLLSWRIGSDGSTDDTDGVIGRTIGNDPSISIRRYERV